MNNISNIEAHSKSSKGIRSEHALDDRSYVVPGVLDITLSMLLLGLLILFSQLMNFQSNPVQTPQNNEPTSHITTDVENYMPRVYMPRTPVE